ncbi:MAG: hypothetical protein NTZ05_09470, partial [Chloroflexi bacterium]|nr:hypothetical protein [Chloroflexota bacterium]
VFIFHRSATNSTLLPTPLCPQTYQWSVGAVSATGIPVGRAIVEGPQNANLRPGNAFTIQASSNPMSPVLTARCGERFSSGPSQLSWNLPEGSTQYQLQVTPYAHDGPSINLIRNAENTYAIAQPSLGNGNYFLLPAMIYAWRVRATAVVTSVDELDASWGPWSQWSLFITGFPQAWTVRPGQQQLGPRSTVSVVSPAPNSVANSLTPTLHWSDTDTAIWYYEVQLSADPKFVTDPAEATAAVYTNYIHAGLSTPLSSWTVPDSAKLPSGTAYYWRVRPRLQGNNENNPAPWSSNFNFQTP